MREYIIYVLLIFLPIGSIMAYFLRREGLGKKNMAIILTLSLLIIITFPITVVRLGILSSFLSYILLIVVITRYLLANEGEFAPQSKGRLVTGPELEKLMETIETRLDSDLSGLRVEAFENLEGDSVPTGLIEGVPEAALVLESTVTTEEMREEEFAAAELLEEDSGELAVKPVVTEEESEAETLHFAIDESRSLDAEIEVETTALEEKAIDGVGSIEEEVILEEIDIMAELELADTGGKGIDLLVEELEEEGEEVEESLEAEEGAEEEKEEIVEEIEEVVEEREETAEGTETEDRIEAKIEPAEYDNDLPDDGAEKIIEKLDEDISIESVENLAEKTIEELADEGESILDEEAANEEVVGVLEAAAVAEPVEEAAWMEEQDLPVAVHDEEPMKIEQADTFKEEDTLIMNNANARILELIEQGFLHKEAANLPEAVACFEEAWDITMDDELKRNLSIELLNIYQFIDENQL